MDMQVMATLIGFIYFMCAVGFLCSVLFPDEQTIAREKFAEECRKTEERKLQRRVARLSQTNRRKSVSA